MGFSKSSAVVVIIGSVLLQTALPAWVGWLCIGSAALFLVLAVIFGDMPPFVYYLVTLTVGIMVYRAASAQVSAVAALS